MICGVPDIRQCWVPRIRWQILQLGSRSQRLHWCLERGIFLFLFYFPHQTQTTAKAWRAKKFKYLPWNYLLLERIPFVLTEGLDMEYFPLFSYILMWQQECNSNKTWKRLSEKQYLVLALLWSYCFKTIKRQTEKKLWYSWYYLSNQPEFWKWIFCKIDSYLSCVLGFL